MCFESELGDLNLPQFNLIFSEFIVFYLDLYEYFNLILINLIN
jgi:hypothetical protein